MTYDRTATIGIGELSERTGASVRSLRYYEQQGLLDAVRTTAGHRRFPADAPETVRRIRMLLKAGLPLATVAKIIPCFAEGGARLDPCVAHHLRNHMTALDARISELDEQRTTLNHLQNLVLT